MYAKTNDKLNTYYYPKWKTIIIIIINDNLLARMESSYTCIKSSLFRMVCLRLAMAYCVKEVYSRHKDAFFP